MDLTEGNIESPKGFKAAGVAAGLKKNGDLDMAMITSDCPATAAAVFTTNIVKAAPVIWDQKVLSGGKCCAVVVNSGNANACTGDQGLADAEETAAYAASLLGCDKSEVFVASTGVIGVPLDMEKIKGGIDALVPSLGGGAENAAQAILTTDTVKKEVSVKTVISGRTITISGIAKGSGMIHPNMATTLCFITTDAAITGECLQRLLGEGIADTFNMISVDGDTSTNDSVIVMANGMAGNPLIEVKSANSKLFAEAFYKVLGELARMIVKDGEGASRFIEAKVMNVRGGATAKTLARSIVSSNLVKAAFFGSDANWGRIVCAMGYSGASFDVNLVDLSFASAKGSIAVLQGGKPIAFDEEKAKEILSEKEVQVLVDCHTGSHSATAWGCDLTYDYVKINGDYRS